MKLSCNFFNNLAGSAGGVVGRGVVPCDVADVLAVDRGGVVRRLTLPRARRPERAVSTEVQTDRRRMTKIGGQG